MNPDPFKNPYFVQRLNQLRDNERRGLIEDLRVFQGVKLTLGEVPWTSPFTYTASNSGASIFEAFKLGHSATFKTIVRLWPHYGPGTLIITAMGRGELRVSQVIVGLTKVDSGTNEGEKV